MNGKRVPTAVLQGMTGGETPRKFLELELKDVAVISYQSSASEEPPFESLSLAFAIIKYTLFLQSANGGVGETISATWNVRTGTGSA
jgi:type VI protein secretion system component Hcp